MPFVSGPSKYPLPKKPPVDTARFANIYTGDLHLRNERGDYTLIEEEDCLTIRFNKTGKRYKFLLERAPEYDE